MARRPGRALNRALPAAAMLLVVLPYLPALLGGRGSLVGSAMPGPSVAGDSDAYDGAWHFWWTALAMDRGVDPRLCYLVYPPEGASLAWQHVGWTDTVVWSLLGVGRGSPALSYNLSLAAGSVLTALFGWLLARSWGAGRVGALFVALALAWLPQRTARVMQHYQLANCWALVAALWLGRVYMTRGGRMLPAALLAAVLAASLESPFHGLSAAAGLAVTALAVRPGWHRSAYAAAALAAGGGLALLLMLTAPGEAGTPAMHWREAVYWSAEPQSFLLPSPFGPAWSLAGLPVRMSWMPNAWEGVVGPGLVVLAAMALGALRDRRWLLPAAAAFLGLLCLGPELRLLGRPTGVPLPFRLLGSLPLLEGIRAPARFALPAGILAVLAAGLAVGRTRSRAARSGLLALMVLELGVVSLPTVPSGVPEACRELGAGRTVTEIPRDPSVRRYALFQTASGYRRSYCFLARPVRPAPEPPVPEERPPGTLVYHRWLFAGSEREELDRECRHLFPGASDSDTVWVSLPPGAGG